MQLEHRHQIDRVTVDLPVDEQAVGACDSVGGEGVQRVHELGFDMALSVGQHTNDKELSYYAHTPSGFEWEVGWNPLVIDETTWEPTTHHRISVWGHTPVGRTIMDTLGRFRTAARSLARREDVRYRSFR